MLQSMTGFGKSACNSELGEITIEIKSLNSKNLDISFNIHPFFKSIENELRSFLSSVFYRGKIEFKISLSSEESFAKINKNIIKEYINELNSVVKADERELLKIAVKLPDAFSKQNLEISSSDKKQLINKIEKASEEVIDFRKKEGEVLEIDLLNQLLVIKNNLDEVILLAPKRIESTKNRLRKSLKDLEIELNMDRFEQELIYYLEKYDINEEIVRLESHLDFFKKEITSGDAQKGKKLGFISQEIGREINTIGSKANYSTIQVHVVEMKNSLEKIKEQLLNVL